MINMGYEDTIAHAGSLGLYQVCVFMTLALATVYYNAEIIANNFITPHHEHWCNVDILHNFTKLQQQNIAIPFTSDSQYSSCEVYDLPWNNFTQQEFETWNRSAHKNTPVVKFQDWKFDDSLFKSSAVSKVMYIFILVCKKKLTYIK